MPPVQYVAVSVSAPVVEGVSPATLKQVAGLSLKLFAAIAAKNYGGAAMIGLQIVALAADALDDSEPGPPPLPES
jgi:hypothetical protein